MKQATGSGLCESFRNRRHFIRNKQAMTLDHHTIWRMYHMMLHTAPLETTKNRGTFNCFMAAISRKTSRHGRDIGVPANVWVTTQPQCAEFLTLTCSLSFYSISHASCQLSQACVSNLPQNSNFYCVRNIPYVHSFPTDNLEDVGTNGK
jgi:hypothetical protein